RLICCAALILLSTAVAFSQTPKPNSGALLSIDGTGTSSGIHLKLYDSQIHSGSVGVVPVDGSGGSACLSSANDNIPTDAYVLQGGAPTGCDPNDPYEVTDNNPNGTHQASGLKLETKFSGFHIETHYLSEPHIRSSGHYAANNNGLAGLHIRPNSQSVGISGVGTDLRRVCDVNDMVPSRPPLVEAELSPW